MSELDPESGGTEVDTLTVRREQASLLNRPFPAAFRVLTGNDQEIPAGTPAQTIG